MSPTVVPVRVTIDTPGVREFIDQRLTELTGTAADIPCRCEHCQRARSHRATTAQSTSDGSGSLPPDDPGPSPTPDFGVIVTLAEDLPAGTQLWVRHQFGELAVDERTGRGSWGLGQFTGLTVEVAP